MRKYRLFCFLPVWLLAISTGAQTSRSNWRNKDKGTVVADFHHIGIYPGDTSETGISNKMLIGISVKLYELSVEGCKRIPGLVKINGKEYPVIDRSSASESDSVYSPDYFSMWASEGNYSFSAFAGKDYYPVKARKYFLTRGASYIFNFYLIRKDALKKTKTK